MEVDIPLHQLPRRHKERGTVIHQVKGYVHKHWPRRPDSTHPESWDAPFVQRLYERLLRVGRICGLMAVDAFRPRGRAASWHQPGRWRRGKTVNPQPRAANSDTQTPPMRM